MGAFAFIGEVISVCMKCLFMRPGILLDVNICLFVLIHFATNTITILTDMCFLVYK